MITKTYWTNWGEFVVVVDYFNFYSFRDEDEATDFFFGMYDFTKERYNH